MDLVLVFGGEYDLDYRDQVRFDLESVADAPALLLDFTRVDYIDRVILDELLHFQKKRKAARLQPAGLVTNPRTDLNRLLKAVGAHSLFPIFESREATLPEGTRAEVRYASAGDTSKETMLLLESSG